MEVEKEIKAYFTEKAKAIKQILKEYEFEECTDSACVNIILRIFPKSFISVFNAIWFYNSTNGIWKLEENELINIAECIVPFWKNRIEKYSKEDNKNMVKALGFWVRKLSSTTGIQSIKKYIIDKTSQNSMYDTFDNVNKNGLMFKNGWFNPDTGEIRPARQDEYVTKLIDFGFTNKSNEKVRKELYDELLLKMFENVEALDYYLKMVASCLNGNRMFEQFYILSGNGRNGKGTMDTLLQKVFCSYYKKIDVKNLTTIKKNANEHSSALAQCNGVRYLSTSEPESNETLVVSKLKEYTGGDLVEARQLFGKAFTYKPQFTITIQCNDKPNLSKLDKATEKRVRIIDFPFEFCDNPVHDYQKKASSNIKEKIEKNKDWHHEFMVILVEYYQKYIKGTKKTEIEKPVTIVNITKEYIEDNNPVLSFIQQYYSYPEDNKESDFWIQVKDIADTYNSYTNETKINSRQMGQALRMNDFKNKKVKGNVHFRVGIFHDE